MKYTILLCLLIQGCVVATTPTDVNLEAPESPETTSDPVPETNPDPVDNHDDPPPPDNSDPDEDPVTETPPPPPVVKPQVLVTVGVGVGGRKLVGVNGYQTILLDEEIFSPEEQNSITTDTTTSKLICPTGWSQNGSACCLAGKANECIGGGWHSDFLFRGIAFGNGRFVAVGGQGHAIVQISTDGVNWGTKHNLVTGSGLVTGAAQSANWFAGVAFGKNRFVAVEGYSGQLFWSLDGMNWIATGKKQTVRNTVRSIYFLGNRFYASGDNSSWGFTDDGSNWTSSGNGTPAPVEVYQVGSESYGFVGTDIYKLSSATATTWDHVYSHTGTIGSFVYNKTNKTFHILASNRSCSATNAAGPWTCVASSAPGRWAHYSGAHFVGNGAQYSANAINWQKTPSPTGATSTILQYASGLIDQ